MATEKGGFLWGFLSTLKDHFLFRKSVFFIAGLIFGYSLVKYAVLTIMIIYLSDNWKEPSLSKAVIILNAQEGLSSIFMIFEAHMADAYLGRFKVVILSTLSMIGGLILLWLLNPAKNLWLFWGVAVLIAMGEAGKEPALKAFLADQLKEDKKNGDPSKNNATPVDQLKGENTAADQLENNATPGDQLKGENTAADQLEKRVNLWCRLFRLLGTLVGTFALERLDTWGKTFLASATVMAVSLLIFLSGYYFGFYYHEKVEPKRSPIWTASEVLSTAYKNRGFEYPKESSDYFKNDGGKIPLSPDIRFTRWVDKAAITVEKGQANEVQQCTATQVKEVKKLLGMVPMWATFVVYCLTQATGSTFFFEQTTSLDRTIGNNYEVPFVSFYLMQTFSGFSISHLSKWVISKRFSGDKTKLLAYKVRIGLGMACSCLALVAARQVESKRLAKVNPKPDGSESDSEKIDMSIFVLTPQFCLLGLMEGLTEDGLVDFFYYQVAGSLKSYGPLFNEFAMGLGKFFNIFWVLTFNGWFKETINESSLDKYYEVLAILSLVNLFVVYTFVSIFVYKNAKGEEPSLYDSLEACLRGCGNAENPPDLKACNPPDLTESSPPDVTTGEANVNCHVDGSKDRVDSNYLFWCCRVFDC